MPGRGDEGAPIIVRSYDLCAELYQHTNRFPRAQRTLLGRLILDEALRMLAALTVANRLAYLPNRAYARLSETIDEVGRMLGGWLEHERAQVVAASVSRCGAPSSSGTGRRRPSRRPCAARKRHPMVA